MSQPNILLINVDDLGWTDLGFMGSSFYETPTINKLASEGTVFTNAYAASANCAPSRACMLTGLMPGRHGIYTVGSSERGDVKTRKLIPAKNNETLSETLPTMATVLGDLGYETAIVGKWHLSDDPTKHGFEFNVGGCHKGQPPSYFAPYKIPTIVDGPENEYLPERLADEVCGFIARKRERPFFLYYSTYLVHTPLQGKDDVVEKYKQKIAAGEATQEHYNPIYAAMIEALDQALARVLAALSNSGQEENTLVIFVSDNGGIRGISRQTPLRAGKGSFYEGGIRIPMTVRWPGKVAAGASNQTPVSNLDFLPTFASIAGSSPAEICCDGDDFSEVMRGKIDPELERRELFWHFPVYLQAYESSLDDGRDPMFRTRPGAVLRKGKWKLHYYYEDDACELYDIECDLGERSDRVAEFPEIVAQLKSLMNEKIRGLAPALPIGANPLYDDTFNRECTAEVAQARLPSPVNETEWLRVMRFID